MLFYFEKVLGGKMNIIVERVIRIGKKVKGKRTNEQPKVPRGHKLIAVIHKESGIVAEDVTYPAKYIGCHVKDCCKTWQRMDLYLLTASQMNRCCWSKSNQLKKD